MDAWDRVAWICLHQPHMTKKELKLDDFHPLRGKKLPSTRDVSGSKKRRAKWVKEGRVAKRLTPAERAASWRRFVKRSEQP